MIQHRKNRLENNYYYHIFSRSIAKYVVFNDERDYFRFIEISKLYRYANSYYQYSKFARLDINSKNQIMKNLKKDNNMLVKVIAYCIMPTHIHFLLKQIKDHGISRYLGNILNSYSRYFNIKFKRIGPLWSSRFKSVLVETDEQLLHLTRYIHLNPTSAGLVNNPGDWQSSSYHEFIDPLKDKISSRENIIPLSAKEYKKFVMDHKNYQREISKIKNIIIDDYTG